MAPGSYDIHVDSDPVAIETLVPNPGGNAKLSLRTHPGNGKGNGKSKGHNKKGMLSIDPRRKLIEVKQGGAVVFSGPMLAQIPGLNVCGAGQCDRHRHAARPRTVLAGAGDGDERAGRELQRLRVAVSALGCLGG